MPALGSLHSFANETDVVDADLINDNFGNLRTWADASVVETDVARTISIEHTWSARQIFPRMAVRGIIGTAFVVPNITQTVIPFDGVEDFDSHGFHEAAVNPSRFTVPAGMAGLYMPFLQVSSTNFTAGGRQFHKVLINGSTAGEAAKSQPGVYRDTSSFSVGFMFPPIVLAVADYVEFSVYQESGGSVTISAGGHNVGGLILLSR